MAQRVNLDWDELKPTSYDVTQNYAWMCAMICDFLDGKDDGQEGKTECVAYSSSDAHYKNNPHWCWLKSSYHSKSDTKFKDHIYSSVCIDRACKVKSYTKDDPPRPVLESYDKKDPDGCVNCVKSDSEWEEDPECPKCIAEGKEGKGKRRRKVTTEAQFGGKCDNDWEEFDCKKVLQLKKVHSDDERESLILTFEEQPVSVSIGLSGGLSELCVSEVALGLYEKRKVLTGADGFRISSESCRTQPPEMRSEGETKGRKCEATLSVPAEDGKGRRDKEGEAGGNQGKEEVAPTCYGGKRLLPVPDPPASLQEPDPVHRPAPKNDTEEDEADLDPALDCPFKNNHPEKEACSHCKLGYDKPWDDIRCKNGRKKRKWKVLKNATNGGETCEEVVQAQGSKHVASR
eukprot:g11629.t1